VSNESIEIDRFRRRYRFSFAATAFAADKDSILRPPAVPLVTSDPYLSVWSEAIA